VSQKRNATDMCSRDAWFKSRLGLPSSNVSVVFPSPVSQTPDSEFNPASTASQEKL